MRRLTIAAAALAAASTFLPNISAAQKVPPIAEQITAAVLPLPEALRAGAGVMGYKTADKLEVLRPAKNGMICLADDPNADEFHVACYADTMEPFMARGRALRASGVKGPQVDTIRFAEAKKGTLKMPTAPAALYQLTGPAGDFDAVTGKTKSSRALFVLYMPYSTPQTTGITDKPGAGPWMMYPGTPKAHLMLSIGM